MNIFKLIRDVSHASESGQQLADPNTWANRASATATTVVLLNAVVGIAGIFFNLDGISQEDISQVAAGVSVVGVFIANKLHIASNIDAGRVK